MCSLQLLDKGVAVDGGITVAKMVHTLPSTWADCVALGRIKFEKYFNHKVCGLIYCYLNLVFSTVTLLQSENDLLPVVISEFYLVLRSTDMQ